MTMLERPTLAPAEAARLLSEAPDKVILSLPFLGAHFGIPDEAVLAELQSGRLKASAPEGVHGMQMWEQGCVNGVQLMDWLSCGCPAAAYALAHLDFLTRAGHA